MKAHTMKVKLDKAKASIKSLKIEILGEDAVKKEETKNQKVVIEKEPEQEQEEEEQILENEKECEQEV